MKINLDNENMYYLFESTGLVMSEYGLVGMDWIDLKKIFQERAEINFYTAEGETIEYAYDKINKLLKHIKYDFAFLFFSMGENYLKYLDTEKFTSVWNRFAAEHLHENSEIIWNVYTSEQSDNCRIYLFCGDEIS